MCAFVVQIKRKKNEVYFQLAERDSTWKGRAGFSKILFWRSNSTSHPIRLRQVTPIKIRFSITVIVWLGTFSSCCFCIWLHLANSLGGWWIGLLFSSSEIISDSLTSCKSDVHLDMFWGGAGLSVSIFRVLHLCCLNLLRNCPFINFLLPWRITNFSLQWYQVRMYGRRDADPCTCTLSGAVSTGILGCVQTHTTLSRCFTLTLGACENKTFPSALTTAVSLFLDFWVSVFSAKFSERNCRHASVLVNGFTLPSPWFPVCSKTKHPKKADFFATVGGSYTQGCVKRQHTRGGLVKLSMHSTQMLLASQK